jgi:hypothetical protein
MQECKGANLGTASSVAQLGSRSRASQALTCDILGSSLSEPSIIPGFPSAAASPTEGRSGRGPRACRSAAYSILFVGMGRSAISEKMYGGAFPRP